MAISLIVHVDNTVPTAADFMTNFDGINDEVRPVAYGGTALSSYTTGDTLYASGTTTLAKLAIGTRGQTYTVGGSTAPTWQRIPIPGYYSRLKTSYTNATTVNITADVLTVVNASGHPVALSAVNVSPAITASGANGLDTGTEQVSAWYFLWVIYNGTTTAGLISVEPTIGTITFPATYTFAWLVGAVFNDSGSNFLPYRQVGNRLYFAGDSTDGPPVEYTNQDGVSLFTAGNTVVHIPAARVVRVFGIAGGDQAGATSGAGVSSTSASNPAGLFMDINLGDSTGSTVMLGYAGAWPFEITWVSGTSIWNANPAGTVAAYRLGVSGFEMDI